MNRDGTIKKEVPLMAKRKRKMLLLLPLLIIPFLTLLFWSMGGGKGEGESKEETKTGLNTNLPDASLHDEKGLDKLSFYELAMKDSLKRKEAAMSDQGERKISIDSGEVTNAATAVTSAPFSSNSGLKTSPYHVTKVAPEEELMQKLSKLQKELERPATAKKRDEGAVAARSTDPSFGGEVDRLEGMMQAMNTAPAEDPEMKQLEGTLEKLLDVQHPERVQQRLREQSLKNQRTVFSLDHYKPAASVSLLQPGGVKSKMPGQFYGTADPSTTTQTNSIEAVVAETVTLVDGANLKLRLLADAYINGTLLPKNKFVVGTASLRGDRLEVSVSSLRSGAAVFPVNLVVIDLDGLPGISIPGAMARDVAKQSASDATGMMNIGVVDPSLQAQAASAGINAAKSLLQKRAKLVKVTIKGGYKVLLQNNDAY